MNDGFGRLLTEEKRFPTAITTTTTAIKQKYADKLEKHAKYLRVFLLFIFIVVVVVCLCQIPK